MDRLRGRSLPAALRGVLDAGDGCLAGERVLWLTMGIVLVGSLLRFHGIDAHGLWSDELFSAATAWLEPSANAPFFEVKSTPEVRLGDSFWTQMGADVHPPLFESILVPWMWLFGPSELSVRFPGFIASVALMLAVFAGLRRLSGTTAACCGLLSVSLNPALIVYARDARQYNLLVLFAALAAMTATAYFQRLLSAERVRLSWREVGPLVLLSITHYYGIALAAVLSAIYGSFALLRKDWRGAGKLALLLGVVLSWGCVNRGGLRWATSGINRWRDYAAIDFFREIVPAAFLAGVPAYVGLAYGVAIVWVAARTIRGGSVRDASAAPLPSIRGERTRCVALLCVVGVYAAVFSLICVYAVRSGTFNPRYTLHTLVALHIGGAIALGSLPGRAVLKVGAVAALSVTSLVGHPNLTRPFYQEYREAAGFVAARIRSGDAVVGSWAPNLKYYYYYLKQLLPDQSYDLRGYSTQREIDEFCAELGAADDSAYRQVFVLTGGGGAAPLMRRFESTCASQYLLVEQNQFRGIRVDRFEVVVGDHEKP